MPQQGAISIHHVTRCMTWFGGQLGNRLFRRPQDSIVEFIHHRVYCRERSHLDNLQKFATSPFWFMDGNLRCAQSVHSGAYIIWNVSWCDISFGVCFAAGQNRTVLSAGFNENEWMNGMKQMNVFFQCMGNALVNSSEAVKVRHHLMWWKPVSSFQVTLNFLYRFCKVLKYIINDFVHLYQFHAELITAICMVFLSEYSSGPC